MTGNNSPEGARPNLGGELSAEKVVMMPNREEMVKRLTKARLMGITPQSDRFFGIFIDQVADSEKVGPGLNMAWELAGYDTLEGYPPLIKAIIDMNFDRAIDIVTPDPEVATRAKEFRKQVLEEVRRQNT